MGKWKPVPDYEGLYEISDDGRLRSLYFDPPRMLNPSLNKDGYEYLGLNRNGCRRFWQVHRLVCVTFHGPPKGEMDASHIDGCRTNNRADNLEWLSHADNIRQKHAHNTVLRGEDHPRARLTRAAVAEIHSKPGVRADLAKKFGVSPSAIDDVRRGKNWAQ
jgi:hypothetical protein